MKKILNQISKIKYGQIEIITPENKKYKFSGITKKPKAILKINSYESINKIINNGSLVFAESYLEGHIKGSINIPWESSDNDKINDQLLDIKYDQDIAIYCSGGDCTLSIDLGEYMFNELSYERVFIFEGGYPSWVENNLPISKGNN